MKRPPKKAAPRPRRRRRRPTSQSLPIDSPWLTAPDAAAYIHRGQRFLRKEIQAGRLRAALVGEKKQILTRREWCDEWILSQATATPFPAGRSRVG